MVVGQKWLSPLNTLSLTVVKFREERCDQFLHAKGNSTKFQDLTDSDYGKDVMDKR